MSPLETPGRSRERPGPADRRSIANERDTLARPRLRFRVLDFASAGADKAQKIGRTAAAYLRASNDAKGASGLMVRTGERGRACARMYTSDVRARAFCGPRAIADS